MAFAPSIPSTSSDLASAGFSLSWTTTSAESDLDRVGKRLGAELTDALQRGQRFVLWLVGDMGAGKTTLTGSTLRAMGHPKDVPVLSPTFTYLNEYRLDDAWLAHIDFYRAAAGFDLEELGMVDARDYRGYFIEWPDHVPSHTHLAPTCVMSIAWVDPDTREYSLWIR